MIPVDARGRWPLPVRVAALLACAALGWALFALLTVSVHAVVSAW